MKEILSEIRAVDAYNKFYSMIPRHIYDRITGINTGNSIFGTNNPQNEEVNLTPFIKYVLDWVRKKVEEFEETYQNMGQVYNQAIRLGNIYTSSSNESAKKMLDVCAKQDYFGFLKNESGNIDISEIQDLVSQYTKGIQNVNKITSDGYIEMYKDENVIITCTLTYEANCHYYGHTKWCTASDLLGEYDGYKMFIQYTVPNYLEEDYRDYDENGVPTEDDYGLDNNGWDYPGDGDRFNGFRPWLEYYGDRYPNILIQIVSEQNTYQILWMLDDNQPCRDGQSICDIDDNPVPYSTVVDFFKLNYNVDIDDILTNYDYSAIKSIIFTMYDNEMYHQIAKRKHTILSCYGELQKIEKTNLFSNLNLIQESLTKINDFYRTNNCTRISEFFAAKYVKETQLPFSYDFTYVHFKTDYMVVKLMALPLTPKLKIQWLMAGYSFIPEVESLYNRLKNDDFAYVVYNIDTLKVINVTKEDLDFYNLSGCLMYCSNMTKGAFIKKLPNLETVDGIASGGECIYVKGYIMIDNYSKSIKKGTPVTVKLYNSINGEKAFEKTGKKLTAKLFQSPFEINIDDTPYSFFPLSYSKKISEMRSLMRKIEMLNE